MSNYKSIKSELYGDERFRNFEYNLGLIGEDLTAAAATQVYIPLFDNALGSRTIAPFFPAKSEFAIIEGLEIIIPKMINYFDVNGVFVDNYFQIVDGVRWQAVVGGNPLVTANRKNSKIVNDMFFTPIDGTGFSKDYKKSNSIVIDKGAEFGLIYTIVTPCTNAGLNDVNIIIRWYGKFFTQTV